MSCISESNQKPFILIMTGIYVEYWIATIISRGASPQGSKEEKSPVEEAGKTEPATSGQDSQKCSCISWMQTAAVPALRIWQIVSMIIILVLDIWDFVDYVRAHQDESGWTHYNCMIQIWVSSSNIKALFVNGLPVFFFGSPDFRDMSCTDYCLSSIYNIVMSCTAIPFVAFMWTHQIPALICYIWVCTLMECAGICMLILVMFCGAKCPVILTLFGLPLQLLNGVMDTDNIVPSKQETKVQTNTLTSVEVQAVAAVKAEELKVVETEAVSKMGFNDVGADEVDLGKEGTDGTEAGEAQEDADETPGKLERSDIKEKVEREKELEKLVFASPLSLILCVIGMLMIPTFAQCYWYSGNTNYMDSLVQVLTERYVHQYLGNITSRFSSMFRFLTTIL